MGFPIGITRLFLECIEDFSEEMTREIITPQCNEYRAKIRCKQNLSVLLRFL